MAKKAKSKKKVNKKAKWIFRLIFLLGFLVMAYPLISRLYYRIDSNDKVSSFNSEVEKLDTAEIDRRINLAKAYNESLSGKIASDPYTRKQQEEGRKEYARMLEVEEMIGTVDIPKINQNLPIYAGTSEDILQKGVGHLEGTSLPIGGNSTHTVITAHRGLPNAKLFRNLDQLVEGDVFYITNIKETIAYKVDKIKVVEPSEFEDVLVVENADLATLLTCTPYMINSHRLLVRGHRIDYQAAIDDGIANTPRARIDFFRMILLMIPIIIFLTLALFRERKKTSELTKELAEIEKRNQTD